MEEPPKSIKLADKAVKTTDAWYGVWLSEGGIGRLLGPTLMSGAFTIASFFTDWADAFGPLGLLSVAVVSFIVGCVALIGVETLKLRRAERLLIQFRKPEKKPQFGLLLRGGNSFSPNRAGHIAAVNAGVLIWNTGDPSHIVEWKMEISVGEITYAGQYSETNPNGMRDIGSGHTIIKWEESFEAKRAAVGEEPIACNVLFMFRAPLQDFSGPQSTWRISFSDIFGNVCTAEYKPSGITSKDLETT